MKTNDVKAAREQRQREKDAREQARLDLLSVMSTPAGRRFVWGLVDDESGTFTGDALTSAFNEGARSVRLALKQRAQAVATREYLEMVREALARVELTSSLPEEPTEAE